MEHFLVALSSSWKMGWFPPTLIHQWVENNLTSIRIFYTDICISRPLTSWYFADSIDMDVRIQMFADVRWVGFLRPLIDEAKKDFAVDKHSSLFASLRAKETKKIF